MTAHCDVPLALMLQPGAHWPGARQSPLPSDMPPGPITLQVPLYPDAVPTTEKESRPSFGVPAAQYLMSASTTYRSAAGIDELIQWYRDAFTACGFKLGGTMSLGQSGVELSRGIQMNRQDGANQIQVSLSFASSPTRGTLILYVAIAITPPAYPVPGSPLRVPGNPVSLQITEYSAARGTMPIRPVRTVSVSDRAAVASLADKINHLPKLLAAWMSYPNDDGSHDTLVFTDADGSTHVVRVGLSGCRIVSAPSPAPGARADEALLARLGTVLKSSAASVPYPFDARTLAPRSTRQLGSVPARFLGIGPGDSPLLYLSRGDVYLESGGGGSPRRVARGAEDATFTVRSTEVLVRPAGASLAHLLLVNTVTGSSTPFALPGDATLLGRMAGAEPARLSGSMGSGSTYVWLHRGRKIGSIDPIHSTSDTFWTPDFLPVSAHLLAVSPGGVRLALDEPGKGLMIRLVGTVQGRIGPVERTVPVEGLRFLSWAPDDTHLTYGAGGALFVLNAANGAVRRVLQLGSDVIHAAAWDPWSRVIALSIGKDGAPAAANRTVLVNADGTGTGRLPMRGVVGLNWSSWHGETLGVTRATTNGTQAWTISLPSIPPDPAAGLG